MVCFGKEILVSCLNNCPSLFIFLKNMSGKNLWWILYYQYNNETALSGALKCICSKIFDSHCTKNLTLFLQMLWKDGISKKIALEYDLFCIIRKDDISFSRKYDFILKTENKKWSFSKKNMEIYFFQMFWKDGQSIKIEVSLCISSECGKS